jgi:hypothetical protein
MASASDRADVITPSLLRVSHRPGCSSSRAWRGQAALLLAGVSSLTGCYVTAPVTTAPGVGTTVVLDLTDRARVDLGDRIGPSASSIQGVVQARSDTAYLLHVSSVTYLNGQSNKWSGEPLTVPTTMVSRARTREFSRGRTTALGAAIAAALAAVFVTTDFFGLSGPDRQSEPPVGGET